MVEINNELPDRILDHLECRDQFIRTLFNDLIHKYLVQPAVQSGKLSLIQTSLDHVFSLSSQLVPIH